jgi:hypothetical protein
VSVKPPVCGAYISAVASATVLPRADGLLGTWRRFHSHFPLADNAPGSVARERHLYVQGTVRPSERSGDCSFCGMSLRSDLVISRLLPWAAF